MNLQTIQKPIQERKTFVGNKNLLAHRLLEPKKSSNGSRKQWQN